MSIASQQSMATDADDLWRWPFDFSGCQHPALVAGPIQDDSATQRIVVIMHHDDGRILVGTETREHTHALIDMEVAWTPRNEVRMEQFAQAMGEKFSLPVYEIRRDGGYLLIQRVKKKAKIPD